MNIIDTQELLPSREVLERVMDLHPLVPHLSSVLDTIEVVVSEVCDVPRERIITDLERKSAVLGLGRSSKEKSNFEYILFHELSHVADRANPSFRYSESLRGSLTEHEAIGVMELWNVFIDARLNAAGLFDLGYQSPCYSRKHGQLPRGVEGKLLEHAVMIENQGVSFERALGTVRGCWSVPPKMWPYEDMVSWMRSGIAEQHA